MDKLFNTIIDKDIVEKSELFKKRLNSKIEFRNNLSSNSMSFEWLDEIELACPYIDTIVRNPKLTLYTEESTIKIEKSKKITVASIKDLARHSHYIGKIDKKTEEIEPSKILDVRKEETFDIYENRFLFTLLNNLNKFVMKQDGLLEDFEASNDKVLQYSANTLLDDEKVDIELKVTSNIVKPAEDNKEFEDVIKSVRTRLDRIKDYMSSWRRSDLIKFMNKTHVAMVTSPIKKTNLILKNPSFQICTRLWYFLQKYEAKANDSIDLDANVGDSLKGLIDHSFLIDYYALDSVDESKKQQKENLGKYALAIVEQELDTMISLLLSAGIKITDEELLQMIADTIKDKKSKQLSNDSEVKNKFKNAMDEYLDKIKEYM